MEVTFVPFELSPQNRCLVAGAADAVHRALTAADAEQALAAARAALLESHGALDLRPHGMASTRCHNELWNALRALLSMIELQLASILVLNLYRILQGSSDLMLGSRCL